MYSNLLEDNSQNQGDYTLKDLFDLMLIQKDNIGNILFLVGTFLSLFSSKQAKDAIVQSKNESLPNQDIPPSLNNPATIVAAASWVFLIASLIFATTSYLNLNKQKGNTSLDSSPMSAKNLTGSEIATLGSFVKVVGFALAAIGNQINANSYKDNTAVN